MLTDASWNDSEDQLAEPGDGPSARPARPQRRGRGMEHDEEDAMPNVKIGQFHDLLRQVLRRVDDWTLVAFNPRYPSPTVR